MHQQNLLFSNILKQNNRPNTHSLYIGLNLHGGNISELQLEGGEDPKDYHVTLLWGMFTPRSDMDDTVCRIQSVMDEIQSQIPKRMVFYHERRFEASKSSDGKDVIVAAVAGGELITVHNKLVKILKKEKIKVEENFEYNPHMTLAYIDPEAEHELRVLDHSAEVKDITVCIKRLDTNEKEYEREFQMAKSFSELIEKFNPYHDSKGRFATSNGAASFTYKPGASTAHTKAIEREKAKAEAETGKGFKGTLYHGSPNTDIEEFDMSRAGQNTSSGEKLLFFTDSKQMTDDFSYERLEGSSKFFQQRGEKGRVYEVDVEMKNPLDFRNLSDKDIDNILKLDEEGLLTKQEVQRYAQSNHQLLKAGLLLTSDSLKELGYDGLIANTGKAGHNSLEYAVVDSKQAKIIKSYEVTNMENNETLSNSSFQITKADDDKRLVFGWALVSATKDGSEIIDHQDDIVEQDELEKAAYEYVLNFRDSGEEHMPGLRKKARMVESVVFTEEKLQAMGIPFGTVPIGWWVGFYVDDDEAWEKIKNGTYRMFSIEGRAVREPVHGPVTKSDSERIGKTFAELMKFNPYHDRLGRFATAGGAASFTYAPGKSKAHDLAIAREKERTANMASATDGKKKVADAENKLKSILRDGAEVNLKGVDPDLAESTVNSIEMVINRYPITKDAYAGFTTEPPRDGFFNDKQGVMACYSTSTKMIHLNTKYYSNKEEFEKKYKDSVERKHSPEGTTADSVIVHEMGHAIDRYLSLQTMDVWKVNWGVDSVSTRLWNNNIKNAKKKGEPFTGKAITDGLSRYATKSAEEYFAEGFAEFMTSPNPRPMAKKVGKHMETYYKKAEKAK